MKKSLIYIFLAALLLITPAITGCNFINQFITGSNPPEPEGEGFAIYLTAQNLSYDEVHQVPLSEIQLADEPLIALDDIVSYSWETHEINLTPEDHDRFNREARGARIFIVCVDIEPIYWGFFWHGFESFLPPDDAVICNLGPWDTPDMIRLGPPYIGNDPRSNTEIWGSLERAGKLKYGVYR